MSEKYTGEYKISSPLTKRLENFWYHYKWHTIVAIFVILAGLLLIMQTCTRVSYDGYIIYAGNHEISRTSKTGDIAPYDKLCSALDEACPDFDGDGKVNLTLLNLFVINDEEAKELIENQPGKEINASLVSEDTNTLSQTILYGDYYLCFMSERLYNEYSEMYSGALFCDLTPYLIEGEEYDMAGKSGIYLSSLDFYGKEGVCDLPPDTVVCLRALSEVSGVLNNEDSARAFERGEEILKNILSYRKQP